MTPTRLPDTLTLFARNVTQANLLVPVDGVKGSYVRSQCCPIAQRLNEMGYTQARVGNGISWGPNNNRQKNTYVSNAVENFMCDWDTQFNIQRFIQENREVAHINERACWEFEQKYKFPIEISLK